MQKKIFITGASGFIGKYVVEELSRQDANILALNRSRYDFNNKVSSCTANLLNKDIISRILLEFSPDVVIHLAAIASPVHGNISEIYNVNAYGSELLLDAVRANCSKGTRVILTSTAGVYGNNMKEFISEDTEYNPQNHYSFSKMIMEYISKIYEDNLDIRIIRPFNMIGKGQSNNFLIPKLVEAFGSRQKVLDVGNLETTRDYVNVEYAAKIYAKLALQKEIPYSILNICSGHGVTGMEILDLLEEITNYRPKIEVNKKFIRKNEIRRLVGDPSRCKAFISNEAIVKNIKDILESMIQMIFIIISVNL